VTRSLTPNVELSGARYERRLDGLVRHSTTAFPVARFPVQIHYRNDKQGALLHGIEHPVWESPSHALRTSPSRTGHACGYATAR
jgi:hypothetical protein